MKNGHRRERTLSVCGGCELVLSNTPHAHAYDSDGSVIETYFSRWAARHGLAGLVDDGVIPSKRMYLLRRRIDLFGLPPNSPYDSIYALLEELTEGVGRLAAALQRAGGKEFQELEWDFSDRRVIAIRLGPLKLGFPVKYGK